MRLDPAPVHRQGRRLDRAVAAAKDPSGLGFGQIPVADLSHRDRFPRARILLGRVCTAGHGAEFDLGLIAGLLDRQYPVSPNHDASAATLGVPVLKDERLQTGRDGADAESSQFAIPQKGLPLFRRSEGVDRPFRQLAHSQLTICSDFAYTTTWRQECKRLVSSLNGEIGG